MVRRKTCQAIIATWLTLTLVATLYYNYYTAHRKTGPISTYQCSGSSPRTRQCVVENFCLDRSGGFVVADSHESKAQMLRDLNVNLVNADSGGDLYYQPRVRWPSSSGGLPFRNETLFVYGLYSPEHFSHMLFNGLMPLYRTLKRYGGDHDSWLYRAGVSFSYPSMGQPLFAADFITRGKDIVTDTHSLTSDQQLRLRDSEPVCFRKAVLGGGDACSLSYYCDTPIESDIYAQFRDDAVDHYVTQGHWKEHNEHSLLHDTNRDDQACVETVQVFEPASRTSDKIIAIVNRSKNRRMTNEDDLIHALKERYTIKRIDFDKGCSLASTAYLMHDVDMLITPHGSQEGAAVFMKDNSIVISINGRGYSENWFGYPFTAMGRRFFNFECESMECVETDAANAKQVFEAFGVRLPSEEAVEECAAWTGDRSPEQCIRDYLPAVEPEKARLASLDYLKSAPRQADLVRLVPFIHRSLHEMEEFKNMSYRQICDLEKCCGHDCDYAIGLNVYGSEKEGSMKAWALDPPGPARGSWHE